jgi:hypothetical protein
VFSLRRNEEFLKTQFNPPSCVFLTFILVAHWCLGNQRNKIRSLNLNLRLNIELASLTCEIQWLAYLLKELQVPLLSPTSVYCDNQSAIFLAHNPTFHEHTKHIKIDCHVIHEKITNDLIRLLPVSSKPACRCLHKALISLSIS